MYYIGYGPCNSIYYEVPNSNFAYRRPSGTNFNLYESERYLRQIVWREFRFLKFRSSPSSYGVQLEQAAPDIRQSHCTP